MKSPPAILPMLLAGLFLGGITACTQPCCQRECDWRHTYEQASLPPALESRPDDVIKPEIPALPDPATVLAPEREPYYLSLPEAFALALEHGTIGIQSVRQPGLAIDDLAGFAGAGLTGSDSIRVLSFQPARSGTAIEASLARFDPFFSTGLNYTGTDIPEQGLASLNNGFQGAFTSSLAKVLSTGGVAGVTFNTNYNFLSQPPTGQFGIVANPYYTPGLTIGLEQPLLRGSGVDINQLLPGYNGSVLFPTLNSRASATSSGILIARLRFDQQRAELERSVNYLLLNVEAAYWNLYGTYVNLFVTEQGLRQAHSAWLTGTAKRDAGLIDSAQLAQIQGQYEQFRGDRMRALANVLNTERNLRVLLGLQVEDGRRLIPIDAPRTTRTNLDWKESLTSALQRRPELLLARQDIKSKNWNLLVQKNFLMPDLRAVGTHTTTGLGTRLDGNGSLTFPDGTQDSSNALRSLTSAHYNSWTAGVTLNMPIGFRYEHAQARDARLALAQSYILLKNEEMKATTLLAKQFSQVVANYEVIEIRRQQRQAQAEQLETRYRKYLAGVKDSPLEFLLAAQQQWISALSQEYAAIVDYNISLATFEFAKGTIMDYNHINISEGDLPSCYVSRAVDHEKKRTRESVAQEKTQAEVSTQTKTSVLPRWPSQAAPSLVAIQHETLAYSDTRDLFSSALANRTDTETPRVKSEAAVEKASFTLHDPDAPARPAPARTTPLPLVTNPPAEPAPPQPVAPAMLGAPVAPPTLGGPEPIQPVSAVIEAPPPSQPRRPVRPVDRTRVTPLPTPASRSAARE